jgi:uncharacterized protein (TIGR00251 family)
MAGRPWTLDARGVDVVVRVTPKAARDAIEGVEERPDGRPVLKVRLRAAAKEGEANAALTRLFARSVGVAPTAVTVVGGASSRIKRLRIAGSGPVIAATLEKIVAIG